MRKNHLKGFLIFVFLNIIVSGFSQEINENVQRVSEILDSLKASGVILDEQHREPRIILTTDEAVRFLQQRNQPQYWKNSRDPLRLAISHLVFQASHPSYDSTAYYLRNYPLDSLNISWDKFYIWEPLRFRIPVIPPPEFILPGDTLAVSDTIGIGGINDSLHVQEIHVPETLRRSGQVIGLQDTTILVVIDTLHEVSSDIPGFPFTYYNYPYQADSIQVAVKLLLDYLDVRDSSIINITGLGNVVTPIWLNSKSGMTHRFWLKNDMNDSVTVWIGAPSRNTLGLYLEQGVSFKRPDKQGASSDARIEVQQIDRSKLLEVQKITVKPQYWRTRSDVSFALNQASLTNWVKGGESSISTSLDITGYADYNNKPLNITSNSFARLKFGLVASGENGVRKNLDLLETNSKLNHKAFGKFDFSAIFLVKTQIAKGYNHTKYKKDGAERDTSILVSKFMNPIIITAGIGLDYKPNKNTSINFSPFSYKGTFVTDTTGIKGVDAIDQTKYGIANDRKSKNEPGASFLFSNVYKPTKTISITNRVQLFTNYINKPQNIDIDWEMILTANLNWFTDVRFNTHLIFDDDTKTPVYDKDKNPVMVGPDNKIQKKTSRIQFKELLGFSFIFRF